MALNMCTLSDSCLNEETARYKSAQLREWLYFKGFPIAPRARGLPQRVLSLFTLMKQCPISVGLTLPSFFLCLDNTVN